MDSSMDNANPTVLDPSDLPSRLATASTQARKDGGTGLFDHLFVSENSRDPFGEYLSSDSESASSETEEQDEDAREEIDAQEIYDLISNITDPEHPLTLGSLSVVNLSDIFVAAPTTPGSLISTVTVLITPTITHCSLATVIGLAVRVRLEQALPPRFRVDARIKEGTHSTDTAVSKQLGDKERVAAALENGTLMGVLKRMLSTA